ncbi:hypothetical protein M0R45_012922 [Rubus argutus]|uniref:Uncharacterized protein n=1 Tax=Rubus argutus TaxID=59490 RepID=A0AAW1XJ36_RUBAR
MVLVGPHLPSRIRSLPEFFTTTAGRPKTLTFTSTTATTSIKHYRHWGLINYAPSIKPLKWEEKDTKSASHGAQSPKAGPKDSSAPPNNKDKKRTCNGCKSLCSIACFVSEKYDMTLCARCYVRGNYQIGVNSSDFRRV